LERPLLDKPESGLPVFILIIKLYAAVQVVYLSGLARKASTDACE